MILILLDIAKMYLVHSYHSSKCIAQTDRQIDLTEIITYLHVDGNKHAFQGHTICKWMVTSMPFKDIPSAKHIDHKHIYNRQKIDDLFI